MSTTSAPSKFHVLRTIKFGGTEHKTFEDFRGALKEARCHINDWAYDILGSPDFTAATEESEVDLVAVSVAELGFQNGASRSDIYMRALELGLELCPPEVGPQLCLQYKAQPMDEWLLIGMEPIAGSGGSLGVFYVGHDGRSLWLYGCNSSFDNFWDISGLWVFVRPK